MTLAGLLIEDRADTVAEPYAHAGDRLDVVGELDGFAVPAHWDEVRPVLSGVTYRLEQADPDVLVLLTGMESGWEDTMVTASVVVLLETGHPDRDARIVVLAVADTPAVPR